MLVDVLSDVLDTAFDGLMLLFGIGAIWHAISIWSHQRSLRKLEVRETGAVRDEGQVAVEGEIRGPVEDALTSPLRQRRGVLVKWKVTEYVGHDAAPGGGWTEVASGYEAVPFLVDDGSGELVVEISGEESLRELELEFDSFGDDPDVEVEVTEQPPRHVREFLDANGVQERQPETSVPTTEGGDEQGDRRYYETILRSGDDVYVAGYATERAGGSDRSPSATVSPPQSGDDGIFYLSDRNRSSALENRLFRVVVTGALGVFLVWYGVSRLAPGVL